MIVAASLVLIVLFSVGFHLLSPWWWTPIASNWGYIDTPLVVTFWITGAVFVAVFGLSSSRSIRRSVIASTDRLHDYERVMAVNYFGPVRMVLALLPHWRERRFGYGSS